jgi:ribosomal protein L7/L12
MTLVYFTAVIAISLAIGVLLAQVRVSRARRKGIYPAKGKATMEDVRRLALSGEITFAIDVYRSIHGVGLKEAKRVVEQIGSSGGKTE